MKQSNKTKKKKQKQQKIINIYGYLWNCMRIWSANTVRFAVKSGKRSILFNEEIKLPKIKKYRSFLPRMPYTHTQPSLNFINGFLMILLRFTIICIQKPLIKLNYFLFIYFDHYVFVSHVIHSIFFFFPQKMGGWRKLWFVLQNQLLLSYSSKEDYERKLVPFKDVLNLVPGTIIRPTKGPRFTIETSTNLIYTFVCLQFKAC